MSVIYVTYAKKGLAVVAIAVEQNLDVFGKIYVDADTGNDTNGDGSRLTSFQSIGRGIDVADSGDTIVVTAEHYIENISLKSAVRVVG